MTASRIFGVLIHNQTPVESDEAAGGFRFEEVVETSEVPADDKIPNVKSKTATDNETRSYRNDRGLRRGFGTIERFGRVQAGLLTTGFDHIPGERSLPITPADSARHGSTAALTNDGPSITWNTPGGRRRGRTTATPTDAGRTDGTLPEDSSHIRRRPEADRSRSGTTDRPSRHRQHTNDR